VVFHDGTPFNAEAVKYNFERMLDPAFASPRRSEVNLVQKVTAIDPLTVQIDLEKSFSPFLATLSDRAGMMISPTAARRLGRNVALEPIGTGPYKMIERRVQERIVLERFDQHWDKALGNIDRIVYRPFTDEQARLANIKAGELDVIEQIPPIEAANLKSDSRFKLYERGGVGWNGLWVNVQGATPFANRALRQAFNATIDRRTMVRVVFGDAAYPANGPFPPGLLGYDAGSNGRIPERNLDLARAKLREAGQPEGFAWTLTILPGRVSQQIAQVLQSMAAEAGIRVNIELVEGGALLEKYRSRRFDATLATWSGRPDPDGNIHSFFVTGGGFNYSNYSNSRVDAMLDAARILTAPDHRRRAYADILTVLNEDLPIIFLWWPKEYKLLSPKVQGFVHISDGMMRFRHVNLAP
jgi:peptide/nickel transport system substrate-binding protein